MPRYFFNTRIGDELISDPDGEVLRDPDRAWELARAMIRELLKTDGADGALLNAIIEVTDDEGEIVLEFPFVEAILDAPGGPITRHWRHLEDNKYIGRPVDVLPMLLVSDDWNGAVCRITYGKQKVAGKQSLPKQ
jgi:hypothetical protein